jgi:hypothetical protein
MKALPTWFTVYIVAPPLGYTDRISWCMKMT